MHVVDTILSAVSESGIDENWYLLESKSTFNAFINDKYLSKIRDDPDLRYPCVHYNARLTYTNNISDLTGYSKPVCYNPKGIYNIL